MRLHALLPSSPCWQSAPAPADTVDYAKSEITFVSKQMNVPVQGRFKKFTAQIIFDPRKLASAKAEIAVDLASIDTGSTEADEEVGKKGWFNTSAFPTAQFSSILSRRQDRIATRPGELHQGIGQDVIAPFSVKRAGDIVTYDGAFKRLQFKIGEAWPDTETVADDAGEIQDLYHKQEIAFHPTAGRQFGRALFNRQHCSTSKGDEIEDPTRSIPDLRHSRCRHRRRFLHRRSIHTYPNFQINHLGFSTMRPLWRDQRQDRARTVARSGSIDITIDATSIDTGHAKRDTHPRARFSMS
jgi:polyisoprenoid-binding protein YceI